MEDDEEPTPEEEKLAKLWIKSNKQILQQMFKGTLLKENPIKEIKKYFKSIEKSLEEDLEQRRYFRTHSAISNDITVFFGLIGWGARQEIPFGDLDSNYRFDILAEKGNNKIIVEVKPELDTREMGQVIGYVHDVEKKFKKVRVFLGTDMLNYDRLFNEGEVGDILFEYAENHGLGVVLNNKDTIILIPAEFIVSNFQK